MSPENCIYTNNPNCYYQIEITQYQALLNGYHQALKTADQLTDPQKRIAERERLNQLYKDLNDLFNNIVTNNCENCIFADS